MKKVRYEEMLPHEIVSARIKCPVAYIPIGTLEWHGEHNCIGLDTVKIHALAIECAKKIGGLVFPPLFYGESRESHLMEANHDPNGKITKKMKLPKSNFASGYMKKSVYEQEKFYIDLLVHIMREIQSLGFKVIVLLAGHYPLLNHAQSAAKLYSLDYGSVKVLTVTGYELVKNKISDAGDHGGKWETSLMLVLRPDCVDMSKLPKDKRKKLIGVSSEINDPRNASYEYGKYGIKLIVEKIHTKVKDLLQEDT